MAFCRSEATSPCDAKLKYFWPVLTNAVRVDASMSLPVKQVWACVAAETASHPAKNTILQLRLHFICKALLSSIDEGLRNCWMQLTMRVMSALSSIVTDSNITL